METLYETTMRLRRSVDEFLTEASKYNEHIKNFMPATYRETQAKIDTEKAEQERRLALPDNVFHLDEIPMILVEVRRMKDERKGKRNA